MDWSKLLTSKYVKTYWDSRRDTDTQYVGIDDLFGSEKQLDDSIDVITGKSGYTPTLLLNTPNSKTIYRGRQNLEVSQKRIPSFKEGMQVDEKHIIDLMKLEGNPNPQLRELVLDRVFNDSYELYRSSRMTREIMVNQLLATGVVSLASNGISFSTDYSINKMTDLTSTAKWSDTANSDPLKDIREMKKKAKINGDARGILNATTFDYIRNNAKVIKLLANAHGVADVADEDLINLVYSRTKVKLYVNDNYYLADDGTDTKVFPDNIVSIFPQGELGKIVFAMTPEERVLFSKPDADVSVIDEGIAIVKHIENDAVAIQTKIAMRCLPRLDVFADQIVSLKVA